ncbi:hypothetical protein Pmani_023721 [Petrolisthes manimaculis]|uniref:Uncharacterized protein n=1 Tax=Petrolisthes manimaculis TaxID=1843537 RepID=A0AAE1PBQ1_9EUCA|nr:hypothetical protein Pmani_023721 [Petrolisthes manimaculis]
MVVVVLLVVTVQHQAASQCSSNNDSPNSPSTPDFTQMPNPINTFAVTLLKQMHSLGIMENFVFSPLQRMDCPGPRVPRGRGTDGGGAGEGPGYKTLQGHFEVAVGESSLRGPRAQVPPVCRDMLKDAVNDLELDEVR